MAFIPTNTIECDSIRLKISEDVYSYFFSIPFKSDYTKYEKIIRETCDRLGFHIEALHPVGVTLVKNPEEVLDENRIVEKLETKKRIYLANKEAYAERIAKR